MIATKKGLLDIYLKIKNRLEKGIYINFGAFHTESVFTPYLLYKCGWNRINIKANPSSFKLFLNIRKRDINLNLAISNSNEILELYYT